MYVQLICFSLRREEKKRREKQRGWHKGCLTWKRSPPIVSPLACLIRLFILLCASEQEEGTIDPGR